MNNNSRLKQIKVSSRYYVLKCGFKVIVLLENTQVKFKPSKVLEGWYDIYFLDTYSGTIPHNELKENFIVDNLLLNKD